MADTIESFVARLKTEGVEVAQQQADQLRGDAEKQAQEVLLDAKKQAEKILADAKTEAEGIIARSKTELSLAARDAGLKLRESLEKAMNTVLSDRVDGVLDSPEYLKDFLQNLVSSYVEADLNGAGNITINVKPEMRKELASWAIKILSKLAREHHDSVSIMDTLNQAGFEFNLTGATIEVTQDSVTQTLMELVGPELREVFDKAISD